VNRTKAKFVWRDAAGIVRKGYVIIENDVPVRIDYKEEIHGAGDVVKAVADKIGVKPCNGCAERRATLNRASQAFARKLSRGNPDR
jgi:hypothetical protein